MPRRQSRPPSSFSFEAAASTQSTSNRMIKWFTKWLKSNTPFVDNRAGINGIETIEDGVNGYIRMNVTGRNKYLASFSRILKPDMFGEKVDIICHLLPNGNKYVHPTTSCKLYKCSSYESVHSALVSGINRLIIKCHGEQMNKNENVSNGDESDANEPNLINVNDPQWLLIKQTREKVCKALFNWEIHNKLNRNNKEKAVLSVQNVCRLFQNLDLLKQNMYPIVCILHLHFMHEFFI